MATVEGVEALFAENLRRRRKQAGLSQAEVMEKMIEAGFAYHQSTIAKIETGTRLVRIAEAVALAEILGVDLVVLLRPLPENTELRERYAAAKNRLLEITEVASRARRDFMDFQVQADALQSGVNRLAEEYERTQKKLLMTQRDLNLVGERLDIAKRVMWEAEEQLGAAAAEVADIERQIDKLAGSDGEG